MPLRVAFDLDGVLADLDGELGRHAEMLFGATPRLDLTRRQVSRLWRHVTCLDSFWETLPELEPGAVALLAARAHDRGWEVIFLTARPECEGATAQLQTQRWLTAHGYPLPSVFVVTGSRGLIASALALDVIIDDRPDHCLDIVADSRARAILVWREQERPSLLASAHQDIDVVGSVAEYLERLAAREKAA